MPAFANRDHPVRFHRSNLLHQAVRPPHGQIGGSNGAQTEMEAPVVRKVEAGLGQHFLRLDVIAVAQSHSRADGAAVVP
jgi:hypothetical protein